MSNVNLISDIETVEILGVRYAIADYERVLSLFHLWVLDRHARRHVCIGNVHTTMLCQDDQKLRDVTNRAALTTMDGQPLVWIAKLKGFKTARRITGPDLVERVCAASLEQGYTHFFLGGAAGVAERMAEHFRTRYPGLVILGVCSPPFRRLSDDEEKRLIDHINGSAPDFLWVGLGARKQEMWIADHLDSIDARIQIGIGAAFDFHAGTIRRAPEWMQRCGLEWLFRLGQEPRRLWRRYLLTNTLFVIYAIPEVARALWGRLFRREPAR